MRQDTFFITLLDGRTLIGFPKKDECLDVDDYLHSEMVNLPKSMSSSVANGHSTYGKASHIFVLEQRNALEICSLHQTDVKHTWKDSIQKQLFRNNIPLFLANKERILSDSRLFLTPIPMKNNLAFVGTDGFQNPTLGVFIEWLLCCPQVIRTDRRHHTWVICHICGSPLSGANHCTWVNELGRTKTAAIYPFLPVWQSFSKVNTRYGTAKTTCETYTLDKAVTLLGGEIPTMDDNPHHGVFHFLRTLWNSLRNNLR